MQSSIANPSSETVNFRVQKCFSMLRGSKLERLQTFTGVSSSFGSVGYSVGDSKGDPTEAYSYTYSSHHKMTVAWRLPIERFCLFAVYLQIAQDVPRKIRLK